MDNVAIEDVLAGPNSTLQPSFEDETVSQAIDSMDGISAETEASEHATGDIVEYAINEKDLSIKSPEFTGIEADSAGAEAAAEEAQKADAQESLTAQGEAPDAPVTTPQSLEHDPAAGEEVKADSINIKGISPRDVALDIASTIASEELPVKEYLDATVVPALREGLRILAKERPEDPNEFLGDYIKAHKG